MAQSLTRRYQLSFLQNTTILSYKTPIKIMPTKNNVQVFLVMDYYTRPSK